MAAVNHGKPVLVEKPGARNAKEIEPLIQLAAEKKVPAKVGFNHRFHPAFVKARQIWDTAALGELMYVRGRYGHGGRLGYEQEWRADPAIAGGGELLDQGVHLIDLSRWFAGEFSEIEGHVGSYFWKMPVEDNGFMLLRTSSQQVAWLHVSCTEWKNLFSFEIFGRDGKLQIDGLGGSYGTERLTYYQMLPEMGPPETLVYEYPGPDQSWAAEFAYFAECIQDGREPEGNLHDAAAALRIVETLYDQRSFPKV
ncbi:MAG TPA: Gfo/Idh/MocA family oxidoreductase, partial [Pyrinomonadaceae bacterium]|nr:Gfo/Idh/MocA family oxidoreductase [Pyrinomonadaceae bacterium]